MNAELTGTRPKFPGKTRSGLRRVGFPLDQAMTGRRLASGP